MTCSAVWIKYRTNFQDEISSSETRIVSFEHFTGQFRVWEIYNNIGPVPTPAVKIFSPGVQESYRVTSVPKIQGVMTSYIPIKHTGHEHSNQLKINRYMMIWYAITQFIQLSSRSHIKCLSKSVLLLCVVGQTSQFTESLVLVGNCKYKLRPEWSNDAISQSSLALKWHSLDCVEIT